MKKLLIKILLVGGISLPALADQTLLARPLHLQGKDKVKVSKVEEQFNKKNNKWVTKEKRETIQDCVYDIKILGKEVVRTNSRVGEHYFGNLSFNCQKNTLSGKNFTAQFSRVLFLNAQSCFDAESTQDGNFCRLQVAAMGTQNERTEIDSGWFSNNKKRTYLTIHSPSAKEKIQSGMLPRGLNIESYNSFQLFDLYMGRAGSEFFMKSNGIDANFSSGVNHYLTVLSSTTDQPGSYIDLERALDYLNTLIAQVENATDPSQQLRLNLLTISSTYQNAQLLLNQVLSPAEYFTYRERLKIIENDLASIMRNYDPNVNEHDSDLIDYDEVFDNFRDLLRN